MFESKIKCKISVIPPNTYHSFGGFLARHSIVDYENVFESQEERLKKTEAHHQAELHFDLEQIVESRHDHRGQDECSED